MTTPLQKIAADVILGKDVVIRDFVNLYGCTIGDTSQIGPFTEIQRSVVIGKRCKIQSHCFLCSGVTLEDDVFVGHGVMFTNDKFPAATNPDGTLQTASDWKELPTLVKKGASIGTGATILPGITIGEGALIGAGAVVTKDVEAKTVVAGNPARVISKI
ncbi:N-acetyltransferase [Candidatus Uhrbacteria bacterium]|nr:N-acetyltransferase [Candidatus Uhrbacteria bacterium]